MTIVIRAERFRIHKAVVENYPMLNDHFARGENEAQWNFRRQETPRSWKILLLAMYGNDIFRTRRDEYKPADFADALMVAAHWRMDTDDVLSSIRFMMNQNFKDLKHWAEVPLNPLTRGLHEALFAEIFDAFQIYKILPQRAQVFHILSFGVFLLKHCNYRFLVDEKVPSVGRDLRELVEEAIRWERSGRQFEGQYTAMFM